MRSIVLVVVLAVSLLAPLAVEAQPAVGVHRIGFVVVSPRSPEPPWLAAFRQGLHDLGYIEGKNVIVETRFAELREERFRDLVDELLRLKIAVLVIGTRAGALAAKKATTTVPIVFAGVSDPLSYGVVTNLARPGGNITGFAVGVSEADFGGKWVELLRRAVPGISHIAVLSGSDPNSARLVKDIQAAAQKLTLKADVLYADHDATLDKAFAAIGASGAQGIIATNTPFFFTKLSTLAQFAARRRLPAIYYYKAFADAGGLMSYGPSLEESYRRAATYVDKILKGAKPGDLPVQQPTKFELVINRASREN